MNRLFIDRTILVLSALFVLGVAIVLWQQKRLYDQLIESHAEGEARRYALTLKAFRTLYTSEVVAVVSDHGIEVTHDYDSPAKQGQAIPLPATLSMILGNELGAKLDGGSMRLYSAYPFPYPGRDGLRDQFAHDAWEALNRDPDQPFQREERINGDYLLRYAIADRMRASCVDCHNTHVDSPKRDWQEGDVRGVLEVSLPITAATAQAATNLRESLVLLSAVGGIGLLGLAIVIGRLRRTSQELEERVQRRTSELEHTTEALTRRETQSRTVIMSSPVPLFLVDRNGEIELLNEEAEKLFGYAHDELLGQSIDLLVPKRSREVHARMRDDFFQASIPRGIGEGRNLIGVRKDQTEVALEIGLTPVETDHGPAVLAAVIDLRERQRAEAELARQAEELRIARDEAVEANKAKSDFLANMSHEIRTPMNAIIGMTELVLETDLDRTQREDLTIVRSSSESLLALINDILDFSKIEAEKLVLDRVEFLLRDSLAETIRSLALRAHSKELEIAWRVDASVPEVVVGDPGRFQQILVNLVGNAIKFTECGEVIVDVGLDDGDDTEVVLHVKVSDTGIGMSQDQLTRVFEAFEQADSSTTRRFGGTGLGLSISMRIVELMKGRLWAESEPGAGATFHFTVRLGVGDPSNANSQPENVDSLRGMRTLIVDDNAANRRILEETMVSFGTVPTTAAGVDEAIAAMRSALSDGEPFELILTDVHMPGADGFELAERIRRDPALKAILIMMLTSGERPVDEELSHRLNVAGYLTKPIQSSKLLDTVLLAVGESPKNVATSSTAEASNINIRPLTVLLAEDSRPNQLLAVRLLEKWGHTVTVANNGREAIALVATQPFDLILMDVQMPEVGGLEATAAIRDLERETHRPHVPIIALTAHALKGDREQCLDAGMDGYISKPIRKLELIAAIEKNCARPQCDDRHLDRSSGQ